jgi:hypothetical protein
MRQAFLNGALTRLADPDKVLREKIVEFVARGDFGLASGQKADGTFDRVWFEKPVSAEEVAFDAQVFLLTKQQAKNQASTPLMSQSQPVGTRNGGEPTGRGGDAAEQAIGDRGVGGQKGSADAAANRIVLRVRGAVTPEVWNKLGVRILPRLRAGSKVCLGIDFSCELNIDDVQAVQTELRQALSDLRLEKAVTISTE